MNAPKKPKPKYLAMLICDYVLRDAETQNKSLIGVFNRINAPNFPVRHDRLHVFVALTNGHGTYTSSLRVRRASGEVLLTLDGKIEMQDPLAVAELNFQIRGLVVPEAGRYVVEFLCDGEVLVDRLFDAAQIEGKEAD